MTQSQPVTTDSPGPKLGRIALCAKEISQRFLARRGARSRQVRPPGTFPQNDSEVPAPGSGHLTCVRQGLRQLTMPLSERYCLATVAESFLSTCTSARYLVRSSVVRAFDTSSMALLTFELTLDLRMIGTMFCARNRFFVSSRTTHFSVTIEE